MHKKHKQIIQEFEGLLSNNIVLTETFYEQLLAYRVFTEAMVGEVRNAPRGKCQEKILQLLLDCKSDCFGGFCDVLEATGHHLLSDCLREAENSESRMKIDIDDLMEKLPFLRGALERKQNYHAVHKFFADKIQREVLKQTWKGDTLVKENIIRNRRKTIEQVWTHEEKTTAKDEALLELQKEYSWLQNHAVELKAEIKALHKKLDERKVKHTEEIIAQAKFGHANSRQNIRLNERAGDADGILSEIQEGVQSAMGASYKTDQDSDAHGQLRENFSTMLKEHRLISDLVDKLREERDFVCHQTGHPILWDHESILDILKKYLIRVHEKTMELEKSVIEVEQEIVEGECTIQDMQHTVHQLEEQSSTGEDKYRNCALLKQELESLNRLLKAREMKERELEDQVKPSLLAKLENLERSAKLKISKREIATEQSNLTAMEETISVPNAVEVKIADKKVSDDFINRVKMTCIPEDQKRLNTQKQPFTPANTANKQHRNPEVVPGPVRIRTVAGGNYPLMPSSAASYQSVLPNSLPAQALTKTLSRSDTILIPHASTAPSNSVLTAYSRRQLAMRAVKLRKAV